MKKLNQILVILAIAAVLQACKGNGKKDDSANDMKNDLPAMKVSEDDGKFAIQAIEIGINDVELSFFAKDKITDPKLKAFADMLLREQGKINTDLMIIARPKNIIFPMALSMDGQEAKQTLDEQAGKGFDKAYADFILKDQKKAVEIFEDGADDVSDSQLKAFAAKTLPVVKKHSADINTISDGLK